MNFQQRAQASAIMPMKRGVRSRGQKEPHIADKWKRKNIRQIVRLTSCPCHHHQHKECPLATCMYFFLDRHMLQLTETTLFHWNMMLEYMSSSSTNLKKNFSGLNPLNKCYSWVNDMHTFNLTQQSTPSILASTRSFALSLALTDLSSLRPPITPPGDGVRQHVSDMDPSDNGDDDSLPTCGIPNPSAVSDFYYIMHALQLHLESQDIVEIDSNFGNSSPHATAAKNLSMVHSQSKAQFMVSLIPFLLTQIWLAMPHRRRTLKCKHHIHACQPLLVQWCIIQYSD